MLREEKEKEKEKRGEKKPRAFCLKSKSKLCLSHDGIYKQLTFLTA